MNRKKIAPALSLATSVALLSISVSWFLGTSVSLERDEDWRWAQPLLGAPPPTAPTIEDLYSPTMFGPGPVEFITDLPMGPYGYAIAEERPILGGHVVIQDSTGNRTAAEVEWGSSSGLGFSAYGALEGFYGGKAKFDFTGAGRFLLLSLNTTIDLEDGVAALMMGGRVATTIPISLIARERTPTSRMHLAWSSDTPVHVSVIDENFHMLGDRSATDYDLEVRSGGSAGVYFIVEGTSSLVTIRAFSLEQQFVGPIFPSFTLAASALLVAGAVRWWAKVAVTASGKPE